MTPAWVTAGLVQAATSPRWQHQLGAAECVLLLCCGVVCAAISAATCVHMRRVSHAARRGGLLCSRAASLFACLLVVSLWLAPLCGWRAVPVTSSWWFGPPPCLTLSTPLLLSKGRVRVLCACRRGGCTMPFSGSAAVQRQQEAAGVVAAATELPEWRHSFPSFMPAQPTRPTGRVCCARTRRHVICGMFAGGAGAGGYLWVGARVLLCVCGAQASVCLRWPCRVACRWARLILPRGWGSCTTGALHGWGCACARPLVLLGWWWWWWWWPVVAMCSSLRRSMRLLPPRTVVAACVSALQL